MQKYALAYWAHFYQNVLIRKEIINMLNGLSMGKYAKVYFALPY